MKKTMIRIIAGLLLLVMLLGALPLSALAAEDTTPPSVTGMQLSASTVAAPGEVEIILYTTDDSGGANGAFVEFLCESQNLTLSVQLFSQYYDYDLGNWATYPNGELRGTLTVDQYMPEATYQLRYVSVADAAGNNFLYMRGQETTTSDSAPLPQALQALSLRVTNSGPQDTQPPILHGATLSASTLTVPGEVEIIVDATDDLSGLAGGSVDLHCDELMHSFMVNLSTTYWDDTRSDWVPYPDGKLHGILNVRNEYAPGGTYQIQEISLIDNVGHFHVYNSTITGDDGIHSPLPQALASLKLTIANPNSQDTQPPVLYSVTLASSTVNVPGQVEVIVKAADDLSGLSGGSVYFYNFENHQGISAELFRNYWDPETGMYGSYPEGELHGILEVTQDYLPGSFQLSLVCLTDQVGNFYVYDRLEVSDTGTAGPLPEAMKSIALEVRESKADGWTQEGGKWYYYRGGQKLKSQWLQDGGNWFYLKSDGTMATGWTQVGSYWYYMNKSGVMQTGWIQEGGKWYFLNSSGTMATGWVRSGSSWYYMNKSGVMQTGWVQDGGKWYYMNAKGNMMTGWLQVGKNWYYLSSKGVMQTGWVSDGKYWYFMNAKGVMQTGWLKDGNYWYYMNKSGVMHTGWLKDGNYWYYMNKSGVMVTGTQVINGKTYVFNSSGVWIG